MLLSSQSESAGRKLIYEYASNNRIRNAENNAQPAEYQYGHLELHEKKADQICGGHYKLICAAFHFCAGAVRLKQIIKGQIMN